MLDGKSDALCDFVNDNDKFVGGIISNTKKITQGCGKFLKRKVSIFR